LTDIPPAPATSSSYTPVAIEVFHKAVQLVEELIKKIRDELTKLINGVNLFMQAAVDKVNDSILGGVVEFFTGDIEANLKKIRQMTEQVRDKVSEILTKAAESVAGAVPVASLFSRGFDINNQVTRPLSGMYGEMTGSDEIDFWRGPAKNTYEKRVQDQQDGVTNATAKVKKLVEYLGEAGAGNMAYMASLGERLGEIYGSIVTACVDLAATAAGALTQAMALLAHFSEVIGTAAGQIVGYISQLGARITEVLNQILQLEAEKADLTGLTADGMWPSPVSD
jgi:phage-related protein